MNEILIGKGEHDVHLLARYANRHGMIAGATGTGKSVSLMLLAEGFSKLGVPVFLADVKGDLAGLSQPGAMSDKLQRAHRPARHRVDAGGQSGRVLGHLRPASAIRCAPRSRKWDRTCSAACSSSTTPKPACSRSCSRPPTTTACCCSTSRTCARCWLGRATTAKELSQHYGLIAPTSIAAIQRALLSLEQAGGDLFFGEPALDLADFMRQDLSGRGIVNILAADQLVLKPKLYTTFLLWMLSELFEKLPEVGDLDLPKLVFFFDEAHLLFDDAPPALRQRVEQVVRLIRSKGVGVYFCSQNPDDVPNVILGQMGNRIQHALRAFTPRDQKAVKAAAETFAPNPRIDVAAVIGQLAVGEALVSTLQEGGVPLPVERTLMSSPRCRIGTITAEERATVRARSPIGARYDIPIDRESAFEILAKRAAQTPPPAAKPSVPGVPAGTPAGGGWMDAAKGLLLGTGRRQGMLEAFAKSAMRNVGGQVGRSILRGVLGSISKR